MKKNELLIIGTLPETSGIGGVTIHLSRLCDYLKKHNYSYTFLDYKNVKLVKQFIEISNFSVVHIHCSNLLYRLILVLFCKILGIKTIITIHGSIKYYKGLSLKLLLFTTRISSYVIVLNQISKNILEKYNADTYLIPAFIPPIKEEKKLDDSIEKQLLIFREKYDKIFATNAYKVAFNKEGREIYGITELVEMFKMNSDYVLIVSNPSGDYLSFFKSKNIDIPENVLVIPYEHSFFEILKKSDAMIRNTITDGDALSIKEALFLNKRVYATNVVDRDKSVLLYSTINELRSLLAYNKDVVFENSIINGGDYLLKFYRKIF